MHQSDEQLLTAARTGQRRAIETLLERYQERVFGFGLRMCGDAEDAKDVLQETLLAAARTIGDFRGDSTLSTWLYTIARSFCIKQRRRSKFALTDQPPADDGDRGAPSSLPGPDDLAARNEVTRALVGALEELEPAWREVLVLRDIEGMTAPEVARITGESVDAVKSRLHRARAAVRDRLAVVLGDSPPPRGPACPDVLTAFSQQLEGDLEPDLCVRLQKHVEACAACRARCDSLKRSLALCANAPAGPVPSPVRDAVRAALRAVLHEPQFGERAATARSWRLRYRK